MDQGLILGRAPYRALPTTTTRGHAVLPRRPGEVCEQTNAPASTGRGSGCLMCEVVGSAVTYSPTPSREQYHRRGRA